MSGRPMAQAHSAALARIEARVLACQLDLGQAPQGGGHAVDVAELATGLEAPLVEGGRLLEFAPLEQDIGDLAPGDGRRAHVAQALVDGHGLRNVTARAK